MQRALTALHNEFRLHEPASAFQESPSLASKS